MDAKHDTKAADIIKKIPPKLLELKVSDEHIALLSFDMRDWEVCAPFLKLNRADIEAIKANNTHVILQSQKSLFRWKEIMAFKATYRFLITTLCVARMENVAIKLKNILLCLPDDSCSEENILDNFRSYLRNLYEHDSEHPSVEQWPSSSLQSISAVQSYVDLSLYDVSLTNSHCDPRTQTCNEKPIKLCDIFEAGDHVKQKQRPRKVILLEGVAGSGKTTLSWHSCKEWAAGKLFQHLRLLIHVSLNNLEVASAKSVCDIIPHPDDDMREKVAKAIQNIDGKNVCFLFDACDEVPKSLWDNFLCRFIKGKSRVALRNCYILMAARPEIHNFFELYPILTARIRTKGFERSNLQNFLDASFSTNEMAKKQVVEIFKINPELVGLCSLPINAVILVHLYHKGLFSNDHLPSTTTGLFKPLVLNFLHRHVQHLSKNNERCPEIKEFSELPLNTKEKFNAICKLAYLAFTDHVRIISEDKLSKQGIHVPDAISMGLLDIHKQLTAYGSKLHYSFIHLSIQEFLAAIHISQMSNDEQATTVQEVLKKSPLTPVLSFYAGLTKLSNAAVFQTLLNVTTKPLDTSHVVAAISESPHIENDRRRLLLALLNCIYETKLPCLVERITLQCHPMSFTDHMPSASFIFLPLNPLDCLSVGFFLGNVSNTWMDLMCCSISDTGLEVLVEQIDINQRRRNMPVTNALNISYNTFSRHTVGLLKVLLKNLRKIGIIQCWNSPKELIAVAIEGVFNNAHLKVLNLGSCNLNASHIDYLVILLVTANNIEELYFDGNNIGSEYVMYLFSAALKLSQVPHLSLENCQIDNAGLHHLANAVCVHKHLTSLLLTHNLFGQHALTDLLKKLAQNDSNLLTLKVNRRVKNHRHDFFIDNIFSNWILQLQKTLSLYDEFDDPRDTTRDQIFSDKIEANFKNPELFVQKVCDH